ncbi:MAG TPA: hypothetical protein VFJ46_08975 [Xanthobacteraceae bacterium]|jgi:hypothetical protein|nr:hypothetical protein [Xanthobacteraceae bacterium]
MVVMLLSALTLHIAVERLAPDHRTAFNVGVPFALMLGETG